MVLHVLQLNDFKIIFIFIVVRCWRLRFKLLISVFGIKDLPAFWKQHVLQLLQDNKKTNC
jgi:hypothetical protein